MTKEQVWASHFFGVSLELRLLLLSFVLGTVFGALYDIFRALRLSFPHPSLAVFFEDVAFTSAFGLGFYTFCTALCRGELRGFVLVGMIAGFLAYILTLGRTVSAGVAFAVKFVRKMLTNLGRILKKITAVLFVMPFFMKKSKKMKENPCQTEAE